MEEEEEEEEEDRRRRRRKGRREWTDGGWRTVVHGEPFGCEDPVQQLHCSWVQDSLTLDNLVQRRQGVKNRPLWESGRGCVNVRETNRETDNVPVLQYSYAPLLQQRLGGTDGVLCHAGTHSWLTRTWQPESLRPGGHAPVGSVLHPSSLQKKQTSDRLSIVKYATIRNGQDQVHRHYMALESGLIEDGGICGPTSCLLYMQDVDCPLISCVLLKYCLFSCVISLSSTVIVFVQI